MPNTPVTWLDQFVVNLTTSGVQRFPQITQLANGNILVSWHTDNDTGAGSSPGIDIVGQIFDPLGNRIGGEITMNSGGFFADDEQDPDIAALPDGGFIMVYEDIDTANSNFSIRLLEFDANGSLVTSSETVASDPNNGAIPEYFNPTVTVGSATSILITYQENEVIGGGDTRIVGKIYNSVTNTYSAEISLINLTGINADSQVAVLNNGNFAIVSFSSGDSGQIALRMVNSVGANVLSVATVADTGTAGNADFAPAIAALSGGGFVVSWTESDGSDVDVLFQRFNSAGAAVGVATLVDGGSVTDDNGESSLVALPDGGFIVFWDDDENLAASGQRYDANGNTVGTTFVIDSNNGNEIEAVLLADGRVALTWEDGEIQMRIIDTRDFVNPEAVYTTPNWQVGTIFNDTFVADVDSDITHGHLGNDDITDTGSSGNNQYFGDEGNDILRVTTAIDSDTWNGGSGNDTIDWSLASISGATFNLGAGTATLGLATEIMVGFENLIGTNNNDTIVGTAGSNVLTALGGNDTINGGAGADTMFGGLGDDRYIVGSLGDSTIENAGEGTDTVFSYINWTLGANIERLELEGSATNATGNGLNNTLVGNSLNNVLNGGAGNDYMRGGAGDDIYIVAAAGDVTAEDPGQGTDTVRSYIDWTLGANVERLELQSSGNINGTGNSLNNTLVGNSAANSLNGGNGNDFISAGAGNDTLVGGAGNDTLIGAAGSDSLNGGTGNDRFDFDLVSHSPAGPATRDSIVGGFAHGFDLIDLATIDANTLVGGNQAFSFIGSAAFSGVAGQLRYSNYSGTVIIDADVNGDSTADMQILVAGTNFMTGTDFIL
jgi:Ca2+-binding RTX toxin-like protein